MVSVREIDNCVFSIVAENEINMYMQSENVILDKKMKFYLNMLKGQLKKIQEKYDKYVTNDQATVNRSTRQLERTIVKVADIKEGEQIKLIKEDIRLISMCDAIMYLYDRAVEKSNTMPKETKTMLKKSCSYWYGFEKYIIKI